MSRADLRFPIYLRGGISSTHSPRGKRIGGWFIERQLPIALCRNRQRTIKTFGAARQQMRAIAVKAALIFLKNNLPSLHDHHRIAQRGSGLIRRRAKVECLRLCVCVCAYANVIPVASAAHMAATTSTWQRLGCIMIRPVGC